jgi:hypothetical protein
MFMILKNSSHGESFEFFINFFKVGNRSLVIIFEVVILEFFEVVQLPYMYKVEIHSINKFVRCGNPFDF